MGLPVPSARELTDGVMSADELADSGSLNKSRKSAREVTQTYQEFTAEMLKTTVAGLSGETQWDTSAEVTGYIGQSPVMPIRKESSRTLHARKALDDYEMAKSAGTVPSWGEFEKEWTLDQPGRHGPSPLRTLRRLQNF